MFTGIIETTGEVVAFTPTAGTARLTIAAPSVAARLRKGDSIAVSGVCLTALEMSPTHRPLDSPQTWRRRRSPAPPSRGLALARW